MKQLLYKFRNILSEPPEEQPEVRHRATILNEVIREGRNAERAVDDTMASRQLDDPRLAYIVDRDKALAGDDPYNSSEFDRADSWKNGGHR